MKKAASLAPRGELPGLLRAAGLLVLLLLVICVVALRFPQQLSYAIVAAAGGLAAFLFVALCPVRIKQRVMYWSILGLLIILPFQNSLNLLVGFSLRPLTLGLPAFLFVNTLVTLWGSRVRPRLYIFEVMALVLVFWAMVYLPVGAAKGGAGVVYGFLLEFQGLFAYFVVRNLSLSEHQRKSALLVMMVPLVVMVGYGVYEYIWAPYHLVDWLVAHSRHALVQSGATLGFYRQQLSGENYYRSQSFELEFVSFGYSGYVLSSILLAVVVLSRRMRRKLWMWLALAASILGLLSSVTLSAVGAFAIATFIVGWEALRRRGRAKYAFACLPLCAVAAVVLAYVLLPQKVQPIVDRVQSVSLADRSRVHTATYAGQLTELLPQYALIGRGTGTSGPGSDKYFPPQEFDYYVENEFVKDGVEWGWLGLVIYLLFMMALLRHVIRLRRRYLAGSLGFAVSIGLLGVAAGYFVIGFYHNVWGGSSIDVQFMVLLALWTAGGSPFDESQAPSKMILQESN